MIQPDCCESFVPFGRGFCKSHPFSGEGALRGREDRPTATTDDSKTESEEVERWKIRSLDGDVQPEEELYVRGRTVVRSTGSSKGSRTVIKSYTVDSKVIDCFWCKFSLPSTEENKESERSFCILENEYFNVFSNSGSVYTAALPFPVHTVWVVPGGLLLERTVTPSELITHKREVPTLFSVMHPLDEPRPVISQAQGKRSFVCDPTLNIIFTSEDCNFAMMYDSVIGLHSVWMISKALPEDMPQSPSTPLPTSDPVGNTVQQPTPFTSALVHSRFSLATPTHSPFKQYTSSPALKAHSPAPVKLMSPALGQFSTSQTRSPFLESPLLMGTRSPSVFRSPPGGHASDQSFLDFFEPLTPEISFKLLWQETTTAIRHGTKGKACKVIQTTGVCGNSYLCYLTEHNNRLRMLKILANDSNLVFVSVVDIQAKDVAPIKKLDMMLVLELDGSLCLYSGQTKACKVMLPSLQVGPSSFHQSQNMQEDEVVLLSPPKDISMEESDKKPDNLQFVQALTNPVPLGCYLVMSSGTHCKLGLHPLCKKSSVSLCISALKSLLPAPVALRLILTFYIMVNQNYQKPTMGEVESFLWCLQHMMGYPDTGDAAVDSEEEMQSDSPAAKKFKSEEGLEGDEAWELLLNTSYHHDVQPSCACLYPDVNRLQSSEEEASGVSQNKLDNTALLFNHVSTVVFALHLVYEELKLDVLAKSDFVVLGKFLCKLTRDLGWSPYTEMYCRDQPCLAPFPEPSSQIQGQLKSLKLQDFISKNPPNVHEWLHSCLEGKMKTPYPLLQTVCQKSYLMIKLYTLFIPLKDGQYVDDPGMLYSRLTGPGLDKMPVDLSHKLSRCQTTAEKAVVFMAENDFTTKDLDRLPFGVSLPLREAIHMCSQDPPFTLSPSAYTLIGREDLALLVSGKSKEVLPQQGPLNKLVLKEGEKDDGMDFNEEIMRLRFGKDLRIQEVRRLLQSAKPVRVSLVQKPEVSDHEFIQEQETKLLLMCKRTMALPVGRGMFTMATSRPVLTETLPIPSLDLTGRAPPRNTTVGLDHVDTPSDMKVWPHFHNGVAAGLRIAPGISQIDSAWIVYNKPKDNQLTNEHAGFLMALGLNGHLASLADMNLHDYLTKGHELTTIGLLIGIAASKRGSMDPSTTKVLSIHVDALLPPTSAELDVPHSSQVAGILGIGLVYQGTAHRRMAEVLLSEIGRPAGPEMENAVNRESYSLSAGLALGLVMLQHGNDALGVADLKMADQLYHYMVGGQKKPQTGTQKEKFKTPSYLIKEGDTVNTDVTAPGATLALALMFMKTNNSAVASWLNAPDTQFLLDSVRPDFLLLRLLSRGLIMWDAIVPSAEWIDSHIPDTESAYLNVFPLQSSWGQDSLIKKTQKNVHLEQRILFPRGLNWENIEIVQKYAFCPNAEAQKLDKMDVDLQTVSQAKANIIAGCCLAIGMRFSGSANQQAFTCLMNYTKYFKNLLSSSLVEQAGKPTIESCLDVTLLALALVMAGTGNLDVLRMARQLRKRHSVDVSYGSHMAIHMAVGLLFLGGGRYTLSSSGPAIAALVCALYPKFPISSTDNRYHLQGFRHLYVLAAEPRVLVTREVDSNIPCYAPIEVTLKSTEHYPETVLTMASPCIIPELDMIKKISLVGPRYLSMNMDIENDHQGTKLLLSKFGSVFVKRRAGYLPYTDDPKGYRNLLARTFPEQSDKTEVIRSFSSEPQMVALAGLFCEKLSVSNEEKKKSAFIAAVLYECITQEKPQATRLYLSMRKAVDNVIKLDPMALWEIKLAFSFYFQAFTRICKYTDCKHKPLLSLDFLTQCKVYVDNAVDQSVSTLPMPLSQCLTSRDEYQRFCSELSSFAVHHNLPLPSSLPKHVLHDIKSSPSLSVLSSWDIPLNVSALVRLQSL